MTWFNCRTVEKVVVNGLPHLGAESGRVLRRTRGQLKASGAALGGDLILLVRLQIHRARCRTRCPHVHQINHVLPVHIHHQLILVVAGQQEAVAAFRAGGELSLAGSRINGNCLIGGIEVGQGWIVPEQAVAFARQQERNRNVGVRLMQTDGYSANVKDSLLMLAQPVLELIGRRYERSAGSARSSSRRARARRRTCRHPSGSASTVFPSLERKLTAPVVAFTDTVTPAVESVTSFFPILTTTLSARHGCGTTGTLGAGISPVGLATTWIIAIATGFDAHGSGRGLQGDAVRILMRFLDGKLRFTGPCWGSSNKKNKNNKERKDPVRFVHCDLLYSFHAFAE